MIWILTFLIFMGFFVAMAIGVLLRKKPIVGTCGGLNSAGLKKNCPVCGQDK